jgi:hypothetical protein
MEWEAPEEVQFGASADCKGKAVAHSQREVLLRECAGVVRTERIRDIW